MRNRDSWRLQARRPIIRPETPSFEDARQRALLLGVGITRPPAPRPGPRPHRGQLPDINLSLAVRVERPSALARLLEWLRRMARRPEPPPLVNKDVKA